MGRYCSRTHHFWNFHSLPMSEKQECIDQHVTLVFNRGPTQAEMASCLHTENIQIRVHHLRGTFLEILLSSYLDLRTELSQLWVIASCLRLLHTRLEVNLIDQGRILESELFSIRDQLPCQSGEESRYVWRLLPIVKGCFALESQNVLIGRRYEHWTWFNHSNKTYDLHFSYIV